jgi:hypothetical protein
MDRLSLVFLIPEERGRTTSTIRGHRWPEQEFVEESRAKQKLLTMKRMMSDPVA